MDFILAETPRYWWPVTVSVPDTDSPGSFVEQSFEVLFEPRDQDAEREARERILALVANQGEQLREDRASLAAVMKDWRGILDPDKTAVPFTPENVDLALRQPWARLAIWKAYHESQLGDAVRLGN